MEEILTCQDWRGYRDLCDGIGAGDNILPLVRRAREDGLGWNLVFRAVIGLPLVYKDREGNRRVLVRAR